MNNADDQDIVCKGQISFVDLDDFSDWAEHWKNMPEFTQEDQTSFKQIIVHFASLEDLKSFSTILNQRVTPNTRSIWFPEAQIGHMTDKRFIDIETPTTK